MSVNLEWKSINDKQEKWLAAQEQNRKIKLFVLLMYSFPLFYSPFALFCPTVSFCIISIYSMTLSYSSFLCVMPSAKYCIIAFMISVPLFAIVHWKVFRHGTQLLQEQKLQHNLRQKTLQKEKRHNIHKQYTGSFAKYPFSENTYKMPVTGK